jgi:hypothetical protein
MRSDGLNPETLALLAVQLNPQLACDDPAKAIELARKLLIAADPELAEQEGARDEEMQLKAESQRQDKLFFHGQLSVADAFQALPGHYKTEKKFAAALRKEKLIIEVQQIDWAQWQKAKSPAQAEKSVTHSEVTSLKAVDELFKRQRKAKQAQDRKRKAPPKKKVRKM